MFFILVFIPFLFFFDSFKLSQSLHQLCLNNLSFDSSIPEIYQALICGKRLPYSELRELFVKGGLIHLMIVSGTHLIFLERLLLKIPFLKTNFIYFFLTLYALTSQLNPPILRALFSFFLSKFSKKWNLFWSPISITLLSGFLCLLYRPNDQDSFSLQLSVLASLLHHSFKSPLKCSFFIYLLILPLINHWQELSSLTVLINWIIAPVISSFLFPLSFLTGFFPFLYVFSDFSWSICLKILKFIQQLPFDKSLHNWCLPKKWIWFYIIFIWFVLFHFKSFLIRMKIKRKS
ncbi:MAG: ComEC/Rec2 family competence protein [Bdellovibrionales bacterium]|nr:ComEC/Rec2 family competence protein [Bdellovibrionales bacterium]